MNSNVGFLNFYTLHGIVRVLGIVGSLYGHLPVLLLIKADYASH